MRHSRLSHQGRTLSWVAAAAVPLDPQSQPPAGPSRALPAWRLLALLEGRSCACAAHPVVSRNSQVPVAAFVERGGTIYSKKLAMLADTMIAGLVVSKTRHGRALLPSGAARSCARRLPVTTAPV